MESQHSGGEIPEGAEVVPRSDDRAPSRRDIVTDHVPKLLPRALIETVGKLVEEEHIGITGQERGEQHEFSLPRRHLSVRFAEEVLVKKRLYLASLLGVRVIEDVAEVRGSRPPQVHHRMVKDAQDSPAGVLPMDADHAFIVVEVQQTAEERRLADAVLPQDHAEVSRIELKVEVENTSGPVGLTEPDDRKARAHSHFCQEPVPTTRENAEDEALYTFTPPQGVGTEAPTVYPPRQS